MIAGMQYDDDQYYSFVLKAPLRPAESEISSRSHVSRAPDCRNLEWDYADCAGTQSNHNRITGAGGGTEIRIRKPDMETRASVRRVRELRRITQFA